MWTSLILLGVFGYTNGIPLEADSRIIGGVNAPEDYAPFMVSLVLQTTVDPWQICGGSLIDSKLVLTAAHCITPFIHNGQLIKAIIGRVGSKIWFSGGTVITFASHYIHPEWDEYNIKNDIAVVETTVPVKFNSQVQPIKLEYKIVGGNEPCYVTGWGRTGPKFGDDYVNLAPTPDYKQKLNVSTLTAKQCAIGLANQPRPLPHHDGRVEICTFHSVGHGMCNGDSGGPLVAHATGKLVGIVSWGNPCARGAPDVYARVSSLSAQRFLKGILDK